MRYYLPTEVVLHNREDDIWVSFLGKVYDVTPVLKKFKKNGMAEGLLANAGKDISHWFDPETKDLKRRVHEITGLKVDYMPQGSVPQTNPAVPTDHWDWQCHHYPLGIEPNRLPWWKNPHYQVGLLSKNARPIRVVNTIVPPPFRNTLIWVAAEETVKEIIQRIIKFNSHAESYTVKYCGVTLHPEKTLHENGVPDERVRFTELGLQDDNYIPSITLYYNDDLTWK